MSVMTITAEKREHHEEGHRSGVVCAARRREAMRCERRLDLQRSGGMGLRKPLRSCDRLRD
jgi:hypothetical protein